MTFLRRFALHFRAIQKNFFELNFFPLGGKCYLKRADSDALVSVLTLQNTLLIATGGAAEQNMRILTMCSGGVIFPGIVAVSVIAFAREIKYGKELKNSAIDNTEK